MWASRGRGLKTFLLGYTFSLVFFLLLGEFFPSSFFCSGIFKFDDFREYSYKGLSYFFVLKKCDNLLTLKFDFSRFDF